MKLVKIDHNRCDSIDATTLIAAPDDWDEECIHSAINLAQDAYLVALREVRSLPDEPPNPGFAPPYDKYPSRIVGEVKAEWQAAKEARDAWEKTKRRLDRDFTSYLLNQGFVDLWDAAETEVECYWGHRHGLGIDFGEAGSTDTLGSPFAGREDR